MSCKLARLAPLRYHLSISTVQYTWQWSSKLAEPHGNTNMEWCSQSALQIKYLNPVTIVTVICCCHCGMISKPGFPQVNLA